LLVSEAADNLVSIYQVSEKERREKENTHKVVMGSAAMTYRKHCGKTDREFSEESRMGPRMDSFSALPGSGVSKTFMSGGGIHHGMPNHHNNTLQTTSATMPKKT
jgi:hypothetical protein